jgi:hypothetical protein
VLGDVNQDHHSRQQAEGSELDRFDREFLVVLADEQNDNCGSKQGDFRAVNPLARNKCEGD